MRAATTLTRTRDADQQGEAISDFGSFVSSAPEPRDIDITLVMATDFRWEDAPRESQTLFSHPDAEARFGASVFWLREGMVSVELMNEFLATWQTKRDGTQRGIVEVQA